MSTASDLSLNNSDNIVKYKTSGEIATRVLKKVIEKSVEGTKIADLCQFGDDLINEECSKVYAKNKNIKKGIAFPTCVNLNHFICHLSPLPSDPEANITLKNGDMVKVELGVHIDGFPASVGHTFVVGASKESPVKGQKADVIKAAHIAAEAALRMFRPGTKNYDITDLVQKICVEQFGVKPVEGLVSCEVKPVVGEGSKQIIFNPTPIQKSNTPVCELGSGEVYNFDLLLSTGPAKAKESSVRTTVHKRIEDVNYHLKMQSSKNLLREVQNKFGYMPFSMRNLEDGSKQRAGLVECVRNRILLPYTVLEEEKDSYLAQCMFTVLMMPNGNIQKITGLPLDESIIESTKNVTDEGILKLLSTSLKASKK